MSRIKRYLNFYIDVEGFVMESLFSTNWQDIQLILS